MQISHNSIWKKDLPEIGKTIKSMPLRQRQELKRDVFDQINNNSKRLGDAKRIALVKLLFCFLPSSRYLIFSLLQRKRDLSDFELHFTIFCFLDQAISLTKDKELKSRLLNAAKDYLIKVDKNYAHAPWMAGEFLGAHISQRLSLPLLKKIYRNSKFDVGKKAGLFGLYRIAEKSKSLGPIKVIKSASENEENRIIKLYAKNLLEKLEE